jgi:tetratricopeptide (TPR) repeat protein
MSDGITEASSSRQTRTRDALVYVAVGILTTLLLSGAKLLIEHSSKGQELELQVFGWLQGSLSQIDVDNPIVVVDITGVPGGKDGSTPRKALQEIINALADQHPRAIAVDVEFSPKPGTTATRDDIDFFFKSCLDVKNYRRVPVFLAVGDNKAAAPQAWLGQEEYKDLAVAVAANSNDSSKLPLWVRSKDSSEKLKSMSYALALEYRKHLPQAPWWIRWAVVTNVEGLNEETQHEETESDATLAYSDRLVNYSKLDQIKGASQSDITDASIRQTGERYKNKLVILGDVVTPMDPIPVPGRQKDEAGSLLIACAAYTLIKEPLFELKSTVRLFLDFSIAGLIIAMVAIIVYRNRDGRIWVGRQALFIYATLIGVVATAWLLVIVAGVLWLDFVFLASALFLHPKVEHLIRKIFKRKQTASLPAEAGATIVKAAVCLGAALVVLASTAQAQTPPSLCEQRIAAFVVNLKLNPKKKKNTCYFRDNKTDSGRALSPADAQKRQFRAGQQLYCDKGCSLVILLCGSGKQETVSKILPDWYPVLNAAANAPLIDQYPDNLRRKAQLFTPASPSTTERFAANRMRMVGSANSSSSRATDGWISTHEGLAGAVANTPDSNKPGAGRPEETQANNTNARAASAAPVGESAQAISIRETADAARPSEDKQNSKESAEEGHKISVAVVPVAVPTPAAQIAQATRTDETAAPANADAPLKGQEEMYPRRTQTLRIVPYESEGAQLFKYPLESEEEERAILEARLVRRKYSNLLAVGNAGRAAKEYASAERAYSEAAALNPRDPRGFQGLGNLYVDQGKWHEAELAYRQALSLAPDSPKISLALGFVLLQPMEGVVPDKLSEAETYVWRAGTVEPNNETVYALLDTIFERRNASLAEIKSFYSRAVELHPTSLYANLDLSRTLGKLGRRSDANHYLHQAEKLASAPAELLVVAETFESQRRYVRAERLLRRALELNPTDARVLYVLGRVLVSREHYSEAVKPLELAVAANLEGAAPGYLLGVAQVQTKDLVHAERNLEEAGTRAPAGGNELLSVAYQLASIGDAYAAEGRLQDATRLYEKALKCDPQDIEIRDKLTEARKKSKS